MAKANNQTITNKNELSIQISLSGLSFCTLQRTESKINSLKHFKFEKQLNPFEALDQLKHLFNTEKFLQEKFETVQLIHVNELSTIVPKPLFNEDSIADYLKFNSKILKSDFITHDDIPVIDSVNVFVPYININNFIYDKYGAFTYKHYSTILISEVLKQEKHNPEPILYVNINNFHFEVIIIKKNKLLFYNTFEYTSKEDFIYYVLFTIEQLDLNPETLNTKLLGEININDDLYKIVYKYIRHVSFGNRFDNYTYIDKANSNHSEYTLIKSF